MLVPAWPGLRHSTPPCTQVPCHPASSPCLQAAEVKAAHKELEAANVSLVEQLASAKAEVGDGVEVGGGALLKRSSCHLSPSR